MKIQWNDLAVIRSLSFAHPNIFLDVYEKKKINYEQIIEEINKYIISGRCIIYCALPRICKELKTYIANKINECEVDLFHRDLTGERKNLSLTKWKTGVTKTIIAKMHLV
jgi:superfamily II DNA helicase RecQ